MKKIYPYLLVLSGIIITISSLVFLISDYEFVTSKYSIYCYSSGQEDARMKDKNKRHYKTLSDCGKPFRSHEDI